MRYGKIVVKSNYEKKGDLVLRSYVRAMQKANLNAFLEGENGIIYGEINEDGLFHELLTNKVIDYDDYEELTLSDIERLFNKEVWDIDIARNIIRKIIFKENVKLDFEVSTMEEKAKDRAIEFEAYDKFLSKINPYMRLGDVQEDDNYFNYDNFSYKCKVLKKRK